MNKNRFFVGMGMGLLVGGCAMKLFTPKKPTAKSVIGKTLRSLGDVADSVTGMMGR